jgi:signal transduction histidine kinase
VTRTRLLRPALRPVLGVAIGGVAVALAARPVAAGDRLDVVLLAAVPAALIAVVGALVLDGLRRRRIATQMVVVALTTLAVVAVGARAAASAMFLSAHDLAVLDLVLVVAALVALTAAFVLATRLSSGVVTLRRITEQIGNRDGERRSLDDTPERAATEAAHRARLPAELTAVADALDALDARLRAGDERQQVLESSRRELVAWVSHDIRTPLAGIRALAEALEDGVVTDDETVARYHRTLRVETDRLTRLVDDLFELSRTSAGVLRLHFERVSLEDLISDAVTASATTARAEGVDLVGHVDGSAATVDVSASELLRAIRNIVDNGIRHTPAGGTVRVDAGVRDGDLRITVTDTGGGIPLAERERIFDAGFSGDAARTPDSHGAGLGLAIARGLVEAHAGTISVDDSPIGARFLVTVPARRPAPDPEPSSADRISID